MGIELSIIIPVHKTEEVGYILKTLSGISRTIEICPEQYTVTLVGTLLTGFYDALMNIKIKTKWNFIPTNALLGNAKNQGADYAIAQYSPDVLVFMDAHMNFYDIESASWGRIIHDFVMSHPDSISSPGISIYDIPGQRAYGVFCEVTEDDKTMDLKWKWVGTPPLNGDPFEVPGLCGCFMAMRPSTFKDGIVGFTPPLAIDDREFNIRMWLLGKTFYSIPRLVVGHRFATGYSDFSRERSIDWGAGHLLYTYLNMDEGSTMRLYEKGIGASQDKAESLRRATTPYWNQMRQILKSKFVRTPEQYFKCFSNQ